MWSVKGRRWDAPVDARFAPRVLRQILRRAAARRAADRLAAVEP